MSKKTSAVKTGILGVIVGAIGGVLFAPKSGKETRKDIKEAAAKANREAEKRLKDIHAELKDKADEARTMTEEYTGKAKSEVEELSKRAEFTKQKVSEMITAVREYEADDDAVEEAIKEGRDIIEKIKQSAGKKKTGKASETPKKR